MSAIEHTPGPWAPVVYVIGKSRSWQIVAGPYGEPVADISVNGPRAEADAKLIAAAPDLAAALRELHDFAVTDSRYPYLAEKLLMFSRAAELLKRVGF